MITAVFLIATCGVYQDSYCLFDPHEYDRPRTEQGCRDLAKQRGWVGGPITCVKVRIAK